MQGFLYLAIPAGTGCALIVAAGVGYFCVQRTGLYFICLTFAFNQMFYFIAYVWTELTGGEDGLVVIPRPDLISGSVSFYVFIALLFFACLLAMLKIVTSPLGLVFRLIRENPSRAAAVGSGAARQASQASMGTVGSVGNLHDFDEAADTGPVVAPAPAAEG